ncbi:acyl transferase [Elysia marginata]|uniref:Acyl transferase n=1 Tax=Elysia marginata TaxID=1093978 RepID=A0AAV4FTD1_9GAST|nr:acyl transferase [Elysia marginata]
MINHLMDVSNFSENGCYVAHPKVLSEILQELDKSKRKHILLGVSYALMDFAERFSLDLSHTIVIETGGMKGHRREMTKIELHNRLKTAFGVRNIHSEYSMTELFSQAYSKLDGKFQTPPWMKVFTREVEDPFSFLKENRYGGINIIDLANIHSCSFIATEDLGRRFSDGAFEIAGRLDHSEVRGCNLLYGEGMA